ncbi:4Fe-4S dicluster domain-containing protein [bacterium]|nr:4Fe-4S dicluster domain-containing protein [bacterium]
MNTIDDKKLDSSFVEEVRNTPGGEKIVDCFACGTCAASCPVREFDERFNPRKIIHMVLLGMRDEVMNSDFVWLCSGCVTCQERCPQGVTITELMMALKNIAVKHNIVHPAFSMQAAEVYRYGRLYEVGDLNARREKIGLPRIPEEPDDIRTILDDTGVGKIAREVIGTSD